MIGAGDAEYLVHGLVEEAADAGAAQARRLGFEIQHLADQAGLPMKLAIAPGSLADEWGELGEHGHRKAAVAGDGLMTARGPDHAAAVGRQQLKQRQTIGRARDALPVELGTQRMAQIAFGLAAAGQRIEAGRETLDAMHEQQRMQPRRERPGLPGRCGARQQRVEQLMECGERHREFRIEALGAAAAENEFGCARRGWRGARRVGWRRGGRITSAAARRGAHLGDHWPAIERMAVEPIGLSRPIIVDRGSSGQWRRRACGRVARRDREQYVGILGLDAGEIAGAIEPHECGQPAAVEAVDDAGGPAERGGRVADGADRVAEIELAIAERALAIFPRLAPVDRGQAEP